MDSFVKEIRKMFPVLDQKVNDYPLAYLDNAATTQKPQSVIDAIAKYYTTDNSNVHRAVHTLGERATKDFEDAREKVRAFINAQSVEECIFTRGTTEAINLVATSFGQKFVSKDDEIIISGMEHHSNIVPWQLLCQRTGAKLKVIPVDNNGELELDKLDSLITEKTKIIAVVYASNSLGTVNHVKEIITKAHEKNIPVLVDGAQANAHFKIDVQSLDCDFYTISGHKMYGPTGIGVLYGKKKWLEQMPPYHGGGEMILEVTYDSSTYNELPHKFEAGTPNIAGAIGLGATIDFFNEVGKENIMKYEHELIEYATNKLQEIPGLKIIGNAKTKISVISFVLDGVHPHDIGTILDQYGVAIRTGHHCTMPLMDSLGIPTTARASFAVYNTFAEIDQLANAIKECQKLFLKRDVK